jgi:hypothetical protein
MVLIKDTTARKLSKIGSKLLKKKELTLTEISIEYDKKKHQEKEDIKNKKLADIAEEKRMREILVPYLDKLQDILEEKGLLSFWIFPDKPGFEKLKNLSFSQMEKITKTNIDKYKNRYISNIRICFFHNEKPSDMFRKENIYMTTDIAVHKIDHKGIIGGSTQGWGAGIAWHGEDFKTTKFSLKLMQILYRSIANKLYNNATVFGYKLTDVIETLEKKGVDFQNTLSPLAGTIKK